MDLSWLAAKQKRIQEWELALASDAASPHVKARLLSLLSEFRTFLAKVWEAGGANEQDKIRLTSLERELEEAHEDIRLVPKRG